MCKIAHYGINIVKPRHVHKKLDICAVLVDNCVVLSNKRVCVVGVIPGFAEIPERVPAPSCRYTFRH